MCLQTQKVSESGNKSKSHKKKYKCHARFTKTFNNEEKNKSNASTSNLEACTNCDCSSGSNSETWTNCFCIENLHCDAYKPKPAYTEEQIQYFVKVLTKELDAYLNKCVDKLPIPCRRNPPEFYLVPVVVDSQSDSSKTEPEYCYCETSETVTESTISACEYPSTPLQYRHEGHLLSIPSDFFKRRVPPFKLDYVDTCHIGKWGECLKVVERILEKRDIKLKAIKFNKSLTSVISHKHTPYDTDNMSCCNEDVCEMPVRANNFEDFNRFKDIESYGYSTLCINLLKWSHCTTKRWRTIRNEPHLVIHMPSMSYPCDLRCKAPIEFEYLQNIQIGRMGWLVNMNTDVLYICPEKSTLETKRNMINLVKIVRPDVCLSRLWIILNNDDCSQCDIKYKSGCESLFYAPSVYRRVKHLSAGRTAFIIPGILNKTDFIIACELTTPIIGPCLKFQERLLDKHYVMSLLADANIQRPPFVQVRNLSDLCEKMTEMMTQSPLCCHKKWLLKINSGFCGNQSALIHLTDDEFQISKEQLFCYLICALPQKLQINKQVYKDSDEFFNEIKRSGAVLMACPAVEYRTISLGCFIEHDTAKACLRTSADVVRTRSRKDSSWSDTGYIIPQTSLPNGTIQELTSKVGNALVAEQFIGFFGTDIVVFYDEDSVNQKALNYWVVDIDPYYTDLLSFDDWRRFCLNKSHLECETEENDKIFSLNDKSHRYVVCSGKLHVDGLLLACDNFFVELCLKKKIAYSHKARTGCMFYPIDLQKKTFLLFSFYRSRELALKNFVLALKALYYSPVDRRKFIKKSYNHSVINLARDMELTYNIAV